MSKWKYKLTGYLQSLEYIKYPAEVVRALLVYNFISEITPETLIIYHVASFQA